MPEVHLEPVAATDKAVLSRLLELCAHDLSEYLPDLRINEHGLFDYPYLDHYWTEEGRFASFIRADGAIAGFVMVRALDVGVSMAEFFVLRSHRRDGIGAFAARAVFSMPAGPWQVEHAARNAPAAAFWKRMIEEAAIGRIDCDSLADGRVIYRFTTGDPPAR